MVFCQNIMKKSYISILKYGSTIFFFNKNKIARPINPKTTTKN